MDASISQHREGGCSGLASVPPPAISSARPHRQAVPSDSPSPPCYRASQRRPRGCPGPSPLEVARVSVSQLSTAELLGARPCQSRAGTRVLMEARPPALSVSPRPCHSCDSSSQTPCPVRAPPERRQENVELKI